MDFNADFTPKSKKPALYLSTGAPKNQLVDVQSKSHENGHTNKELLNNKQPSAVNL